jgi:hypothetical protein
MSMQYAMILSVDASASFDVVIIKLLLKQLKIIDLPMHLVELIQVWLTEQKYYVTVNGECLMFSDLESITIQGSVHMFVTLIQHCRPFIVCQR